MMESPGGAGLTSIVVGNRRVRFAAHNGFLLRGWRRGTATTAKFSSRGSNRSGLATLRGIFALYLSQFPCMRGGDNNCYVTILLRPRMKLLHRSKGNCRGNRFAGRENFSQGNQPNCGGAPIHQKRWKNPSSALVFLLALALPS